MLDALINCEVKYERKSKKKEKNSIKDRKAAIQFYKFFIM